jgi:hypothetical protein
MLTGPKRAISGPNEPSRLKPGHRGQLARLIRERPVFVNLADWGVISKSGSRKVENRFSEKIMSKQEDKETGQIQQGCSDPGGTSGPLKRRISCEYIGDRGVFP